MSKWVPILVRLEDYDEVTSLVASREADRDEVNAPAPALEVGHPDSPLHLGISGEGGPLARRASWSLEDLAKLAQGSTLTAQRWTRAMDVCVQAREHNEIWVPTSEVAKRAGMDINEWRDAPRKISRHLKAHFPNVPKDESGNAWWPLCAGGDDMPANGGEVWWAITEDMARRWRHLRGPGQSDDGETLG